MRILLVEDEERMAQALCEILRQENYEVDHWGGGWDPGTICHRNGCL